MKVSVVKQAEESSIGEDFHVQARRTIDHAIDQTAQGIAEDVPGAELHLSPGDRRNLLMLALLDSDAERTITLTLRAKSLAQVKNDLRGEASDVRIRMARLADHAPPGLLPYTPRFQLLEGNAPLESAADLGRYLEALGRAVDAVSPRFDHALQMLKDRISSDSSVAVILRMESALAVVRDLPASVPAPRDRVHNRVPRHFEVISLPAS